MGHSKDWRPMKLDPEPVYDEPQVDAFTIVLVALSEVDNRLRRIETSLDKLLLAKEQL